MSKQAVLVITRRKEQILTALIEDQRLLRVQMEKEENVRVGDIYIGRIRNIVQNIGAAFVDIGGGTLCFLPLGKAENPILTNRTYDGRLKEGDEIVVQIVREALKTKDAACDTNLSFAGRYAVVTTGKRKIGFSGKLTREQKRRFSSVLKEHFPDIPFGIVVRTNAGALADETCLIEEIKELCRQAETLFDIAKSRTCFSRLKETMPLWLLAIRDTYGSLYDRIVTDDRPLYERMQKYLLEEMPDSVSRLSFYEDPLISLSALYGLEGKLKEALEKKVWLKSGGYLVIEPTEALTVIDVNTGKKTGKHEKSENFYQINREACEEIARQLILRNLSGIIVVDFINMDRKEQEEALLACLSALLARDPVQADVVDMTTLGLVEITRKKVSRSLAEQLK